MEIPVKAASNLLRRLHQMGFLKRRRTRRLCLPFRGKPCYRGVQYSYSFSRQGVSYVRWLREWKPLEDLFYTQLTFDVVSSLPQELTDRLTALSAVRSCFRYRGPTRNLRLFDSDAVPVAYLVLLNRVLTEETRRLLIDNEVTRYQLEQNRKAREEERNMLYRNWAATLVEAAKIHNERQEWKIKAEDYCATLQSAKQVINDTRRFSERTFREYRTFCNTRMAREEAGDSSMLAAY